ncbi:DUF3795 domain-containing protein [Candidatus Bipolaricaulota bacterium]
MLAYCGINCTECSAYKATVTSDEKLMHHVEEKFGDGTGTYRDWVCLGCLHPKPALIAKYCATCKIRGCAVERNVDICAACLDYDDCEKLQSFIKEEDEAVALRMRWLRDAFVTRTQAAG